MSNMPNKFLPINIRQQIGLNLKTIVYFTSSIYIAQWYY